MKGPEDVIVTIDKDGNVQIEVNGVKGSSCEELTRELETALGVVTSSRRTSEYHQHATTGQHQRLRRD